VARKLRLRASYLSNVSDGVITLTPRTGQGVHALCSRGPRKIHLPTGGSYGEGNGGSRTRRWFFPT